MIFLFMKPMKTKGFTLIELIIVVAIIAILATIAYPSYNTYIVSSRRADAQTALLDTASSLETYFSNNNTYATATFTNLGLSSTSDQGYYTLSFTTLTASAYTIKATPRGAQATQDTQCQSFTLNSLGIKGITAGPAGTPTGTAADCW